MPLTELLVTLKDLEKKQGNVSPRRLSENLFVLISQDQRLVPSLSLQQFSLPVHFIKYLIIFTVSCTIINACAFKNAFKLSPITY